jgi:hypothetical protein
VSEAGALGAVIKGKQIIGFSAGAAALAGIHANWQLPLKSGHRRSLPWVPPVFLSRTETAVPGETPA